MKYEEKITAIERIKAYDEYNNKISTKISKYIFWLGAICIYFFM